MRLSLSVLVCNCVFACGYMCFSVFVFDGIFVFGCVL